jgi:hypothetical protein
MIQVGGTHTETKIVQQLLRRPIPRELWHYTTLCGFEGIVASGRLWATDVRFLNDRTEFIHSRKIAEGLIAEMPSCGVEEIWAKAKAQEVLDDYFEIGPLSPSRLELYTVSFTVLEDTLSQWRGYGIDGVSLCFDLQQIRPPEEIASLVSFAPCIYEEQEKRALVACALQGFVSKVLTLYRATGDLGWAAQRLRAWNQLTLHEQAAQVSLNAWNEKYLKEELHRQYVLTAADLLRVAALCKDRTFHEEQEWRLMLPVHRDRPLQYTARSYRTRNDEEVPYITTSLFAGQVRLPLTRVVVGPGGDVATRREAIEDGLRLADYVIPVDSSKVPLRFL